jgi:hypothetical protein
MKGILAPGGQVVEGATVHPGGGGCIYDQQACEDVQEQQAMSCPCVPPLASHGGAGSLVGRRGTHPRCSPHVPQ